MRVDQEAAQADVVRTFAFAIIASSAARPSVSAAGPGCRINGDLISYNAPYFTAGMSSKPGLWASFSGRNFLPHHEPNDMRLVADDFLSRHDAILC
jgi:hypothetical protein